MPPQLEKNHVGPTSTGKDSDAGKDGRQEEKGVTKDEMVGWHHRLNGHEFVRRQTSVLLGQRVAPQPPPREVVSVKAWASSSPFGVVRW